MEYLRSDPGIFKYKEIINNNRINKPAGECLIYTCNILYMQETAGVGVKDFIDMLIQ